MQNLKISKITLGTAQFGTKYGIANKKGKPSIQETNNILKFAIKNGINSFDTAPTYGNSEDILGNFFNKNPQNLPQFVIIKIPQIQCITKNPTFSDIYKIVKMSVKNSKNRLGLKKISLCLLHNPNDMLRYNGLVVQSLSKLKEEGFIDMIGASVYTPDEVKTFLKIKAFDAIQIPINLFDIRLITRELIRELINDEKIIFARSVFLQGLFFLEPENLPSNLRIAKKYLQKLHNISSKYKISITRLAFSFVRDIHGIDSMILGVENEKQLRNNIDLLQSVPLPDEVIREIHKSFNEVPEKVINPSMWIKEDYKE